MAVNDDLLDASLAHATYVQRFGTGLARRILTLLEEADTDLKAQIAARLVVTTERGYDPGPVTTARLETLLGTITETRAAGYTALQTALTVELVEFAAYEGDFQRRMVERIIPIPKGINAPPRQLLTSIVTSRPMQGRTLRQWMGDLEAAERKAIRSAITIGMVEGESIPNIVKRVGDRVDLSRRQVTAIVQTAVNHVSNHARQAVAESNQDIVKAIQWHATLDGRTCPICGGRDGNTYPLESGPRPPAHISCRCTILTVLKSWQEMGLEAKDVPVGVRSSMNGDVPADMRYGDWLRKQPKAFVSDTLGPSRAKLFLDGKLPIDRFTDRRGGELTLAELKERESAAWAKAFGAAA